MIERLASYDYRGLGRAMRQKLESDGRGWRVCAAEIGVTATDLSRVAAGQPVAAHKVIAICDWIGADPRAWYRAPDKDATAARSPSAALPGAKPVSGDSVRARKGFTENVSR